MFRLWQQANDGELTMVMPAVAVAEANNVIGATGIGSLIVRHVLHHVLHVARQVRGGIVTGAPWQYPAGVVPIWTI